MPFVGEIFSQLKAAADTTVLQEIRDGQVTGVTGRGLLELIRKARTFFAAERAEERRPLRLAGCEQHSLDGGRFGCDGRGVDCRSALLPPGSGGVSRDDEGQHAVSGLLRRRGAARRNRAELGRATLERRRIFFLMRSLQVSKAVSLDRPQVRDDDPVTIIYTSGTSGEAKGVVLTAANVGFMLGCTSARLDSLMGGRSGQDRIFHYLPFSFCASWIAVLTFLLRGSLVTLNTDLTKIPSDMPAVLRTIS